MPGLVKSEMTKSLGLGMDTDHFTSMVLQQLKAGEFYVVSHSHNKVRLEERYTKIGAAFDKYAPRYEEDDQFDIRTIVLKDERKTIASRATRAAMARVTAWDISPSSDKASGHSICCAARWSAFVC